MNPNKIVVISSKNLQNLQGLHYVQQNSNTSVGQQQQQIEESTFGSDGDGGGGATNDLNGATTTGTQQQQRTGPVSVTFGSNQIITIPAPGAAVEVITGPPQLESIITNQTTDDQDQDQSENASGDEYSFQDNDEEDAYQNDERREPGVTTTNRAPSMNLRYTGTRIPGRGFDGGVGKSIVYKDGIQRELTLQEVIDILANPDLSKLSTMPPVRPRGGTMYLYRCPDYETRHDLRADQYLWCQQGTKKMPKEDPVVKRFYMYIRTEEPIKNVSKRPKKTFTKYDVRFKKCEYELMNAEDPLVLIHYTGDESVWKPFRNRNLTSLANDGPFIRIMKNVRNSAPDSSGISLRSKDIYQTVVTPTQPLPGDGYDNANKEPSRNYLKFHNRSRLSSRGGITVTTSTSAKRPRQSDINIDSDFNESVAAADAIAMGDSNFDGISEGGRRLDANESFVPSTTGDEETGINTDVRTKFDTIFPTYELCQNSRMHGFVHSLGMVPQVVVTAASRYLLNLANDLAQLGVTKKTNRFEFYYVSAGPLAGGYYLSTLLFRHCLFDVEPIVPVAFLLHERRNTNDHRRLFELIKEKCPDVASTECVFITDREYGNISSALPKAVQLYSWHYIEDDVVNWVENNGGNTEEANAYLSDVQSLMKAKDVDKFYRELALKRRLWPASFSNFFDSCLKLDIVSKGGRWRSEGLNVGVYDPFCGVVIPACNYLNELVGDLVAWQQASLEQLLQCMYYFSEYYVREIESSMHQMGTFKLFPQFGHYARPSRRLRTFPELEVTDPRQIVNYVRDSS